MGRVVGIYRRWFYSGRFQTATSIDYGRRELAKRNAAKVPNSKLKSSAIEESRSRKMTAKLKLSSWYGDAARSIGISNKTPPNAGRCDGLIGFSVVHRLVRCTFGFGSACDAASASASGQGRTCRRRHRSVRSHPSSGCAGTSPPTPASGQGTKSLRDRLAEGIPDRRKR
jgi:hypothetical protein